MSRVKEPSKAATRRTDEVGALVALDLFFVHDVNGKKHTVLSAVDHASTYHWARVLPDQRASTVKAAFYEGWVTFVGQPPEVAIDAGTEFQGAFVELLEALATKDKTHATEAHWKGGIGERHGGILKVIVKKLIEEFSVASYDEMVEVVAEGTYSKNNERGSVRINGCWEVKSPFRDRCWTRQGSVLRTRPSAQRPSSQRELRREKQPGTHG